MGVQVIADEYYLLGIGIVLIHKPLYLMRLVVPFSGLADRDPSPSPEGFVEHECTACPLPYIFMVDLLGVVVIRHFYRRIGGNRQLDLPY